MLYSVSHHSPFVRQAVEVRCPWNQLGQLTSLIKEDRGTRICVTDVEKTNLDSAIQQIARLEELTKNFTVSCGDIAVLHSLIDIDYPAYLRFPVCDWETYQSLKSIGVSDIYIDGPIAFQTKQLALSKGDMMLRASPQVSPNIAMSSLDSNENSFYIRPEDLYRYDGIVDIVDFREKNQEKENVLYTIYNRGSWVGDLRELVETLNLSVQNPYLKPEFGESRMNCGQRCKVPGATCHLCRTQFTLIDMVVKYFSEDTSN